MKRITIAAYLLIVGLVIISCNTAPQSTGRLQGQVTIGPISPVERPGEKPPIPPEVYQARKVMVYDEEGNDLIEQVDLGPEGYYRVELRPGTYLVDINNIGIDSSRQVPEVIEIEEGKTVVLNIDIDTGIR